MHRLTLKLMLTVKKQCITQVWKLWK